ncbi:flagellar export chaperone FliS [Sediminispirochaeta smaragdinae]|uniref:Flagellar secretion chaperone FliS n=1 Tax=Sediminispirochaeta smaragdinae (strain DSM 11293 / JCM 15392 / SEBR 4228) TaxID=573413 RepID=E1R7Q9_SEDSS|nr:flagellar export chaperone FliS [Sediminispirochaeta smaragdinae]ADK82764.1 flagellar protein FliS [Sediminispirochaeta smaragdinae DSM 11293]
MNRYNGVNAYKTTSIKTAGGGKLIIMLYDEAIKQLEYAVKLLGAESKKYDAINAAILRAQDMVTELMVSLDFDQGGEIATGLFSLYTFFNRQMMEANLEKNSDKLSVVKNQLSELREAWDQIISGKASKSEGSSSGGINIAG